MYPVEVVPKLKPVAPKAVGTVRLGVDGAVRLKSAPLKSDGVGGLKVVSSIPSKMSVLRIAL